MIPDEAVEAAAAYLDGVFDFIGSPTDMRSAMRKALEAATPFIGVDALEEWAVQFASGAVEEADSRDHAERKLRQIRECIADGVETPSLEPMAVVHRYRIEESELTKWTATK